MSYISIALPITTYRAGPLFDPDGPCVVNSSLGEGLIAVAPNTPFVIEESEGRRLVECWKDHGAKIISENVAEPPAAAPAGKKTIILDRVTAVIAGPRHAPKYIRRSDLPVQVGIIDQILVPPGRAFEAEAGEADRLIARHGGRVVGGAP